MDKGKIPITKNFELEYRYFDRDTSYKYYNRKFEVFLLEKKPLRSDYIIHMDNSDIKHMVPSVYKATHRKKYDFGVSTLNWNDIKMTFLDFIVEEIGEENRTQAKKALVKLSSPKL
jgi:hypothetical protein